MRIYSEDSLHKKRYVIVQSSSSAQVAPHLHEYIELTYILDGRALHIIDGNEYIIGAGDFFLIDRGSWHSYQKTDTSELPMVNILLSPRFFDLSLDGEASFENILRSEIIRFSPALLRESPCGRIYHDADGSIRDKFNHALSESRRHSAGYREMVRADVVFILITMLRQVYEAPKINARKKFVSFLIDYIEKNYALQINLSSLCEDLNYSLPYVSQSFKAETGRNFCDYLKNFRIAKSCVMLRNTDRPVEEICGAVGYSNTTFFHKIFKSTMGITPLQYRSMKFVI